MVAHFNLRRLNTEVDADADADGLGGGRGGRRGKGGGEDGEGGRRGGGKPVVEDIPWCVQGARGVCFVRFSA